jgi:hypothetical protein
MRTFMKSPICLGFEDAGAPQYRANLDHDRNIREDTLE